MRCHPRHSLFTKVAFRLKHRELRESWDCRRRGAMSLKLKKTYSVVCEETKFEWKISEKSLMRVNKEDFLTLAPHLYGLVRVVCDGKIDIQKIQRPTLASTDGYKELVELRNEAQRDALEPAEKRARRAAMTKVFGEDKKATKSQGFTSTGGRKGDTVTIKVNGSEVVMLPPLRANEPPRVRFDEDMILTCLEHMKMRIGSVNDVLNKRAWTAKHEGEAESEQLDDDAGPVGPVDGLLTTETYTRVD